MDRRTFLRTCLLGAVSVSGVGVVGIAQRLLTANQGGGISLPSFDDEFDGPPAGWRWQPGSPVPEFDSATYPGNVLLGSGRIIHRARIPAMPFTVTAHASHLEFDDIDAVFGASMLCVGGSGPLVTTTGHPFYALQWDIAFLGEIGMIDGTWSNYTTQIHQNTYVKLGDDDAFEVPHYLRLTVNSESSISSYYSLDGSNWTTYLSNYNPNLGVPIDSVLLAAFGCEVAFDWVRFS